MADPTPERKVLNEMTDQTPKRLVSGRRQIKIRSINDKCFNTKIHQRNSYSHSQVHEYVKRKDSRKTKCVRPMYPLASITIAPPKRVLTKVKQPTYHLHKLLIAKQACLINVLLDVIDSPTSVVRQVSGTNSIEILSCLCSFCRERRHFRTYSPRQILRVHLHSLDYCIFQSVL